MSATPQQVLDFLKTSAPFDVLADDALQDLAKHARLIYLAAENQNQLLQENADRLFLIQSGQFSVKDSDGPERHLSEGDYFGFHSIIDGVSHPIEVKIDSPGLVYCFESEAFKALLSTPEVANFFEGTKSEALQNPLGL